VREGSRGKTTDSFHSIDPRPHASDGLDYDASRFPRLLQPGEFARGSLLRRPLTFRSRRTGTTSPDSNPSNRLASAGNRLSTRVSSSLSFRLSSSPKLTPSPILDTDDMPAALKAWSHSLETGDPYSVEYRCRRGDGTWRWMLGRALPLRSLTGEIEAWFGT